MRLKRANGRCQTEDSNVHFGRTARRATDNGAVAGNGTYLAFDRRIFERGGEVRRGGRAERSNDNRKTASVFFYEKGIIGSAGAEARYGSVRTSKDHLQRVAEEARTTTKSPPHRLAQPIFHQ